MNVEENKNDYFKDLPEKVQKAIHDANVTVKLRSLAGEYKLHLDKWALLEDLIMQTLAGIKNAEEMPANVSAVTGLSIEESLKMVDDIAVKIFQPIRKQLEEEVTGKKKRAIQTLTKRGHEAETETEQSESYHNTKLKSSERKEIANDPYREQID